MLKFQKVVGSFLLPLGRTVSYPLLGVRWTLTDSRNSQVGDAAAQIVTVGTRMRT